MRKNNDELLLYLMSLPPFRRWLYLLLSKGRIVPFAENTNYQYFLLGRSSIIKDIEQVVRSIAPDFFLTMEKENQNDRTNTRNTDNADIF